MAGEIRYRGQSFTRAELEDLLEQSKAISQLELGDEFTYCCLPWRVIDMHPLRDVTEHWLCTFDDNDESPLFIAVCTDDWTTAPFFPHDDEDVTVVHKAKALNKEDEDYL